MNVFIASDHAGYDLKKILMDYISNEINIPVSKIEDFGPFSGDPVDYPYYAFKVAKEVSKERENDPKGILICGSGVGMSMVANRIPGVRAALCQDAEMVKLTMKHNGTNVLCMGAKFVSISEAKKMVKEFMIPLVMTEERHIRRVELIDLIQEVIY